MNCSAARRGRARRLALWSLCLPVLTGSLFCRPTEAADASGAAPELELQRVDPAAADTSTTLDSVTVTAERARPVAASAGAGQQRTELDRARFKDAPGQSIAETLALVPGVTFVTGNGPRDVSVSVRGSNNRQTFGIRNLKVYEDGFPVTQPDGLARTDLTDPHAYGLVDILQGPSSAYHGNYATGGAIDFQLRQGRELDGVEAAFDFGGNGYTNLYAIAGAADDRFEYTAFGSQARGASDTAHTDYISTTANLLARFEATPRDRLTVKFIHNDTDADLSIRLSLNQYRLNPYQQSCERAQSAGCASVSLFANGINGTRQTVSAEQADLLRNDRRTIVGARWEHDLDTRTVVRTQAVFDNRDIQQPTSATAAVGTFPSYNLGSDLIHAGRLLGWPARTVAGLLYNTEDLHSNTLNVTPAGGATLGATTQIVSGTHANLGLRLREELTIDPRLSASLGLGAELTRLSATSTAFTYPAAAAPLSTRIDGKRRYWNWSPEYGLRYTVDEALALRGRVAGGYGTPQATNLFVTAQGTPGNNTDLKPQRNLGIDLGADWRWRGVLDASLTGFYEFFRDELVTQSAGANLQSFTFNAPRSEHRGLEAGLDLHPLPQRLPGAHLALAYLYDDQRYTDYTERLSAGTQSNRFVRDGNAIPGVQPQSLNARLIYDATAGSLQGLGAYLEASYRQSFQLDNANQLKAPGFTIWNANLHYDPPRGSGWHRFGAYLAVQNLFDETYVASASNVADTLNPATGAQNGSDVLAASTGSIYAGTRRLIYAGLKTRF